MSNFLSEWRPGYGLSVLAGLFDNVGKYSGEDRGPLASRASMSSAMVSNSPIGQNYNGTVIKFVQTKMLDNVDDIFFALVDEFGDFTKDPWGYIKNVCLRMWEKIKDIYSEVVSFLKTVGNIIMDALGHLLGLIVALLVVVVTTFVTAPGAFMSAMYCLTNSTRIAEDSAWQVRT